eukprot:TRINITY_DN5239_c0_g3_i1.p2 TRINITY_DN5239_c0_g3~~TRINITY_DN5239_c0_g3_i1.p2  ORF type:complete len:100 (+),score=4.48 TRINITY_DN5239_c0_g3_i1:99-398(+)
MHPDVRHKEANNEGYTSDVGCRRLPLNAELLKLLTCPTPEERKTTQVPVGRKAGLASPVDREIKNYLSVYTRVVVIHPYSLVTVVLSGQSIFTRVGKLN